MTGSGHAAYAPLKSSGYKTCTPMDSHPPVGGEGVGGGRRGEEEEEEEGEEEEEERKKRRRRRRSRLACAAPHQSPRPARPDTMIPLLHLGY